MAHGTIITVLHHLRQAAMSRDPCERSDGQLLADFLDKRDEASFAEIMRRHGPMVLATCRRLSGNAADAEDCFQATFLVLVRAAASLRSRETVGNWLYGVAYHTALKARTQARRRRDKELTVRTVPQFQPGPEDCFQEVQAVLDEELNRLPARFREAFVLCDLEGKTRKEAARLLRVAHGTLSGRLTTARRTLARRLAHRGVALSAGALAVLVSRHAIAALPGRLTNATLHAAVSAGGGWANAGSVVPERVIRLTEGVIRMLRVKKLFVALTLTLSSVGLGGLGLWGLGAAAPPAAGAQSAVGSAAPTQRKDAANTELAKVLQSALDDAAAITDPFQRAAAYGYIAQVQFRAGRKEKAKESLRKAIEAEDGETGAAAQMHKDSRLEMLAEFQAETGDVEGAWETVGKVSALNTAHALGRLAQAQAHGDVKAALATAEKSEGVYQQESLWQIATIQAKAGDIKAARDTVIRIGGGSFHKAAGLVAIAVACGKANESIAAAKYIEEAQQALPGDGTERLLGLGALAEALAALGKTDDAGKAAAAIDDGLWRDRARARVVAALAAREDLKGARAVAETINDEFNKGEALKAIVTSLIRAKDLSAAAKAAAAIGSDMGRCYALLEIARAQAAAGHKAEATQALEDARRLADRLENPEGLGGVRAAALAHAAGAWAAIGGRAAALEWAAQQTDPWIRAMARVRVAEAIADSPRK
jgi:RNA polymerase sigma factor (sigma-70 family)